MLKRGLISLALVFVLIMSFCGASYADIMPPIQVVTLTVQELPNAGSPIYPPMVVYTAQLNFSPDPTSTKIIVDFYNTKDVDPAMYEYIGSAPVDPTTGKAVLNKQVVSGAYRAISKTVINGQGFASNIVYYKVY